MTQSALLRFILLGAIWGSSFLFMRIISPVIGGFWTADLRLLIGALTLLVLMRLRGQVGALRSNATPSNYIALEHLNAMEQGELRLAFEGVAKFQSFIEHHFKLQLLRN